jgi:sulfotransferase family protein
MNVIELEHRFDAELRVRHTIASWKALIDSGCRWSEAVWSEAESIGSIVVSREEQELGLELARHAIFVCGAHRSGTTLIRDLLDGHPALSILPSEGTFYTNHAAQLRTLTDAEQLRFLACEWVRRLANPINQAPYWLLGRTSTHNSPYVGFARSLMAWWQILCRRFDGSVLSWPMAAIALAYAHCMGTLSSRSALRWWGEKTPTNERFLARLRADYPAAKVILVVRHPAAVLASRRVVEQMSLGTFRQRRRVLEELRTSYEVAAAEQRSAATQQFMLIKYERLVEEPLATVESIAHYLGIEVLPTLLRPTVAGMFSSSNSSFLHRDLSGQIHPDSASSTAVPTKADLQLAAVVGDAASRVGYELAPDTSWRVRLYRLGSRLHQLRQPQH